MLGESPVIEVFPQSALLLEVDLNGRLPTEAVNDELNAFYHRISLSRASDTLPLFLEGKRGELLAQTISEGPKHHLTSALSSCPIAGAR